MSKVSEICCAILGHPQLGLRRLNSTTAAMISRLGPLGPGFPRFFGENSNFYFCFCRKSRNRKSVAGRRATAACLSLRLERKEAKKPSRIRWSGFDIGSAFPSSIEDDELLREQEILGDDSREAVLAAEHYEAAKKLRKQRQQKVHAE